jgi:hypothetical protein
MKQPQTGQRMQTEIGTQMMNVNPNPYPHGRWTPRTAPDAASRLIRAPTVGTLEKANLYQKFWDVLESSLKAENEELIHLVLPAPGAQSRQAGAPA